MMETKKTELRDVNLEFRNTSELWEKVWIVESVCNDLCKKQASIDVFLTLEKVIVHSESRNDAKKALRSVLLSLRWNLTWYRTCSLPFPEIHTEYFMYLLSQTYLPPMGLATQKGRKLRAQQRLRKQAKPVYLQSHDETWHTQTVQTPQYRS